VDKEAFLPQKLTFGIDDPEVAEDSSGIAINLSNLVFKSTNSATRLIPHFRLLSKCISRQQNGDLQVSLKKQTNLNLFLNHFKQKKIEN
jgi:hypothetical protein